MADTFSKEERSAIMRKVRSARNKSTETRLIDYFRKKGIKGWRRNYPVVGKPDFVLPKMRIAIFTDGCFWHGHDCRNLKPRQNKEYWDLKIQRNKARDLYVTQALESKRWSVIRIWECELKDERKVEEKLRGLHKGCG